MNTLESQGENVQYINAAEAWKADPRNRKRVGPAVAGQAKLWDGRLSRELGPTFPRAGRSARPAALLLSASLLTACATQTPEPRIEIREVKVPIVQACIRSDMNLEPAFPDTDEALRATAGPDDLLQLLAAGRLLRVQTMKEWAAALKACR